MISKQALITAVQEGVRSRDVPELCEKILEFLLSPKAKNLNHVSYGTIRQALGLISEDKDVNEELFRSTTYLSSKPIQVLEMHFQFFDDELDEAFHVDDKHIVEAMQSGAFYHPTTGIEISDFEKNLFPYFEPTRLLRSIHDKS